MDKYIITYPASYNLEFCFLSLQIRSLISKKEAHIVLKNILALVSSLSLYVVT